MAACLQTHETRAALAARGLQRWAALARLKSARVQASVAREAKQVLEEVADRYLKSADAPIAAAHKSRPASPSTQ